MLTERIPMLLELTNYKTGGLVLVRVSEIGMCRRIQADPLDGSAEHTWMEGRSDGSMFLRGWCVCVKETPEQIRDLIARGGGAP